MDSIDAEKIFDWGAKNHSSANIFQIQDKSSFFIPIGEQEITIVSYEMEKFPEIVKTFQALWKNDEVMQKIVRVCAVAMMKQKPSEIETEKELIEKNDDDSTIPPFIYVF